MIRKELAKDPKLANESWDRFLPQFRKRHLKTSEKTAKKNEKLQVKAEARTAAGLVANADEAKKETRKEKDKKKVYTPFPPAQQPRKVCSTSNDLIALGPLSPHEGDSVASTRARWISSTRPSSSNNILFQSNLFCLPRVHVYLFSQVDTQLETGEYFLKAREKEARETQRRKQQVRSFLHY